MFLEITFGSRQRPDAIWLGLTSRAYSMAPTLDSLLDAELSAGGYRRAMLAPGTWQIQGDPIMASNSRGNFINLSSERWPDILGWFLVAESSENGPTLIGWANLSEPQILLSNDTLELPVSFGFDG